MAKSKRKKSPDKEDNKQEQENLWKRRPLFDYVSKIKQRIGKEQL